MKLAMKILQTLLTHAASIKKMIPLEEKLTRHYRRYNSQMFDPRFGMAEFADRLDRWKPTMNHKFR